MVENGKQQAKAGRKENGKQNGNRRKADVQSKQDLLAALTRQAEVNTRILERERAAVLAMEIQTVESQTQQHHNAHGPGYGPGAGQGHRPGYGPGPGHGPGRGAKAGFPPPGPGPPMFHEHPHKAANARTKAGAPGRPPPLQVGPGRPGNGRSHVFMDAQKKVFDPSQVPGLMGGGNDSMQPGRNPWSPFDVPSDANASMGGPNPLEGTFPDSPGFYPGMVFNVPAEQMLPPPPPAPGPGRQGSWGPAGGGFPPQQQQQQQQQQWAPRPSPRGPWQGMTMESQGQAPGPGGWGPGSMAGQQQQQGWPPPPPPQQQQQQEQQQQQQFGGWGGGGGGGRDEQAMKREAYRRELDEQVRSKQQAKEAEKAARKRQEEQDEARAMAEAPWGGPGGGRGRGGGGEPLRDGMGRQLVDLRGADGRSPGAQPQAPPPWQAMAPPYGYKGPPQNLTVQIPDSGYPGPGAYRPSGMQPQDQGTMMPMGQAPGPYAAWPSPTAAGQPNRGGPWGASPSGGGMIPGASGPGVSPGGGAGRGKFMAGLQELRPGPSDDQRRHQDLQRQKLQADLQEQIRQKKEREARAKAEEEAARRKEETDMQAYYQQMQAQKDAEQRSRNNEEQAPQQAAPSPRPAPYQQQQQQLPPPDVAPAHQVGGRRRANKIIEADWLDKISLPPDPPPQQQQQQQESPQGGVSGMRGVRDSGEAARLSGPGPAGAAATRASNKGEITVLLQELQKEQVRLREEFVRQADLVQNMVKGGSSGAHGAANNKDQAFQDLNRIRQQLSQVEVAALNATDSLDQFVVSTHLVPRNVNAIPSRLTTPLEAEWVKSSLAPGQDARSNRMDSISPRPSYDQGPSRKSYGGPLAVIPDEDEQFLDCLDQLLGQSDQQQFWQQLQSPQSLQYGGRRGGGKNLPAVPYSSSAPYEDHDLGERGLYQPISQLPGPPSLIPRAPRGPPSGHAAVPPLPGSRIAGSFFNLNGQGPVAAAQQQQQQQQMQQQMQMQQRRQAPGRQQSRPPNSPPILRADHLPSPDRRDRRSGAPAASRLGGGGGGGWAGKQGPAAAAAAANELPKAGRRGGRAPEHIPKPAGRRPGPPPSMTPHLPALHPPRSSGTPPRPMEIIEAPRAASANPRLEESVAGLASAAAGLGVHPSSVK